MTSLAPRLILSGQKKCQFAFEKLIEALTTAPILALPREDCPVILDTDACDVSIGGVLSQVIDGQEKVVAYASKALNQSQRNYCATYKELLAVVKMAKTFRPYIYGQKEVLLRTDHRALLWLRNFKHCEGMLARWLTSLSEYNFNIQYRPGKKHGNADGCSRIPVRKCQRSDCPDPAHNEKRMVATVRQGNENHSWHFQASLDPRKPVVAEKEPVASATIGSLLSDNSHKIQVNAAGQDRVSTNQQVSTNWLDSWTTADLVSRQIQDPALALVKEWVESKTRPAFKDITDQPGVVKNLWSQFNTLFIRDGKLCRRHKLPCGEEVEQLVVPSCLRRDIFHSLHTSKLGGHMGIGSLISKIRRRFYWPCYKEDLTRWTGWCDVCQKRKDHGRQRAPLQQLPVGMPMERIAVDILGPLPVTDRGMRYVVVFCDYFTRWTEAFPLPDQKAATVADCLVTEIIVKLGAPYVIHSDQGPNFESELFAEICKLLGITKTRTYGYRPQSDGLVERFNRTLQDMIAKLVNEYRNDWDEILPYVLCAYRATPHQSTGMTPNLLMLGREALLPVDLVYGHAVQEHRTCPIEYVEWVRQAMEESFQRCRQHMGSAALRQAKNYNRLAGDPKYDVGDWVLLFYPPMAKQKLALKFLGPYRVTKKLGEVNYEIESPKTGKKKVVHINHLKKYLSEVTEADQVNLPNLPVTDIIQETPGGSENDDDQGTMVQPDQQHPWIPQEVRHAGPQVPGSPLNPEAPVFVPRRSRQPPQRYGHNIGFS